MPDIILTEFIDPHYRDVCSNYKTGTIMYFKCFFIKEDIFHRNLNWRKKNENLLWSRYNDLLNEIKNNETDNDVEMN